MTRTRRPSALVTGGSRGVGAATALALGGRGFDVAITYRNKAARAEQVLTELASRGARSLAVGGNMTDPDAAAHLFAEVERWTDRLDLLVLNASGGMERDLLAADPDYPMRLNRDAQLAILDGARPLLAGGGTVVFVTSHWAHLYGSVAQLPDYEPVARSKHAGEQALRARIEALAAEGIRLVVVTGDLVEGTITATLLERKAPGLAAGRREAVGGLPTTTEMGEAIARAATDPSLPSGQTIVVGGALETLGEIGDTA
jgi:NAD(P)-dependent dehydrogenase (short-subunit alcohol dehydrogenase family)